MQARFPILIPRNGTQLVFNERFTLWALFEISSLDPAYSVHLSALEIFVAGRTSKYCRGWWSRNTE
jgi:hypothetical protein